MTVERAAITGASGLVGGNLAALLLEEGVRVRATRRATSKTAHLDDLDIEWVEASLEDQDGLARAFDDADVVFHCAAVPTQTRNSDGLHRRANVDGTVHVVDAVKRAGAGRLVHCSSVVTCAIAAPGGPDVGEDAPWNFAEHGLAEAYSESKREAESFVRGATSPAAGGVDAVIVNPGTMFGPRDAKPSTGRLILAVAEGRVLAAPSGTSNFVDVRDVCRGMIAAWRKGKTGERYILGGVNLSYIEAFGVIARALGNKPPRFVLPDGLLGLAGKLGDVVERVRHREVDLNSAVTAYAVCKGYRFSSDKAVRELGYTVSPLEDAVRDEIAWLKEHGMLAEKG